MYSHLLTEFANGIYIITINRPAKLNALNQAVITELGLAIDEVCQNGAIKSAIITGSGTKAFVAGADIGEFTNMNSNDGTLLALRGQQLVFNRIENAPKPIIAAVNGFALGGGCELALACHFRLATDTAKFGQPEVNLGLIPGYGGTQRLTQLIGKGKAMELLMTGELISAQQALQLGLVNYTTTHDELLPKTISILQTIQAKAPLAISNIIKLVNQTTPMLSEGLKKEAEIFGELFDTQDAKEGVAAFFEKRKPVFIGK